MSCGNFGPSEFSPEYNLRFKPENNSACCGGNSPDCDKPSTARVGSHRWEWEQVHGKLVTRITEELDENGRWRLTIKREPCPLKAGGLKRTACCSLRYKVVR